MGILKDRREKRKSLAEKGRLEEKLNLLLLDLKEGGFNYILLKKEIENFVNSVRNPEFLNKDF